MRYEILYFYNVYGPGQIKNGKMSALIAIFEKQYKNKKPLTIVKPGTQLRDYTHIDDIIDGLVLVGENGFGDEFGIGSNEAFTILEIAEMFGGKVEMLPERKGNRISADVVCQRTKDLGWREQRNIRSYISEIVKEECYD